MPNKASRIGVKPSSDFYEKQITASDVLDEVTGKTLEEHMNDEATHTPIDDFARVALTGDFNDLQNIPDLKNMAINCGTF